MAISAKKKIYGKSIDAFYVTLTLNIDHKHLFGAFQPCINALCFSCNLWIAIRIIVQLLKKLKHLHHKPIRIECMICSWLLNIKLWNMIEIVLCFSIMIHFLLMEPKIFYNSDTTTWWQRLLDILFWFVNKVCNVLSTVSLRQKSRFHLFVNLKACLP